MTARQKRGGKYLDDPMVMIDPAFLAAAIEGSGLAVADVAERLGHGENRQTIHAMMRGDTLKRCRRSRRQRLADLLEVPENWLSGQFMRDVANAPGWASLVGILGGLLWSPRALLALMRLSTRVETAAKRDGLDAALTDTTLANALWVLASPQSWRGAVLNKDGGARWTEPERSVQEGRGLAGVLAGLARPADEEAAALNLVRSLSFALEPWFEGRATLASDRLVQLAALLSDDAKTIHPRNRGGR